MDQPQDPAEHAGAPHQGAAAELVPVAPEVLETVLVSTTELPGAPAERPSLPAVQAAAVAAGGFLAGAAMVGVLARHRRARPPAPRPRRLLRRRGAAARRQSSAGDLLQVVASRSLLVDVHLLGVPGADR
jgi:hypothetical protein